MGNLYFSVANGGEGDGRIYQLIPSVDLVGDATFSLRSNQPFYTVLLKTVDGFWAGDFTFDTQDNLYLCNGNRIPDFIYKVTREGSSKYGSPNSVYKSTQEAIKGIAIDPSNPNFAYYANWGRILYRLDMGNLRRSVEFSGNVAGSHNPRLSDVAFDIRIRR